MRRTKFFYSLSSFSLFIILLYSCATVEISKKPFKGSPIENDVQYGIASWYGEDFHDRPTASGVIYDMYGMSAAHRTLPLGTRVKATNLKNEREVEIVINDRGPFVDGRILDLSYGAAERLDMIEDGVVPVRIEVLERDESYIKSVKGEVSRDGEYVVQIGAFLDASNADRLKSILSWRYDRVYVEEADIGDKVFHRVRIGGFEEPSLVYEQAERLAEEGYSVWITRTH